MPVLTEKQVWASPNVVITTEIRVRGVSESKVQGHLMILSNGFECQIFPLGCRFFLGDVTFSWSAALFVRFYLVFFDSEMHVDIFVQVIQTVNLMGVGQGTASRSRTIGTAKNREQQQAKQEQQEQRRMRNSMGIRESLERKNGTCERIYVS